MSAEIQLPTELTLESVNKTFKQIIESFKCDKSQQESHISELKTELSEKITFHDVVRTFSENFPKTQEKMMYVDIYTFDGIIKAISQKITTNLNTLSDNIFKHEEVSNKLFKQINKIQDLLKKKNISLEEKLENCFNYAQGYFKKSFVQQRKKSILELWKQHTENQKKTRAQLKKVLKNVSKNTASFRFSKWKLRVR